jgi:uncharacterized YccA/Bax inhibitor family protein
MRTGNPILTDTTFEAGGRATQTMTLRGVINRSLILLLIVVAASAATWNLASTQPGVAYTASIFGALGGLVVGLVTSFRKSWAPVTAPVYAALQGLFIGAISWSLEKRFPGIAVQSVCLTFGVMFALLGAYQTGIIRPSQTFRSIIVGATGGILLIYLLNLVLSLFFHHPLSFISGNGPLAIGFSLLVVSIAALNLVLDFDFIATGVAGGAPKSLEWFAAFGLTVTLVWLYIEILRLLSKIRSND